LGITIHQAGLNQAQAETVYAVTRMYLTVLFARAQKQVVDEQIKRLQVYQRIVKEGQRRDVTQMAADKITLHLSLARTHLTAAEQGEKRAMAALAEAIGLDPSTCFLVPEEPLPIAQSIPSCQEIIALALARRGELVQASVIARIVDLEAAAQNKTFLPTAKTFASGSDIHSKPIPQGHADHEYWPGAINIEMPAFMAGPRWARVERVHELGARAAAVVDKTRNLIVLECEDAFYKWEEAANKIPNAKQAVEAGGRVIDAARKGLEEVGGIRVEDLLISEGEVARAHATLNEALYQQAIELAALQRATAGAFDPGFAVAVSVQN
jgi:outer membrane protein TolC